MSFANRYSCNLPLPATPSGITSEDKPSDQPRSGPNAQIRPKFAFVTHSFHSQVFTRASEHLGRSFPGQGRGPSTARSTEALQSPNLEGFQVKAWFPRNMLAVIGGKPAGARSAGGALNCGQGLGGRMEGLVEKEKNTAFPFERKVEVYVRHGRNLSKRAGYQRHGYKTR